MGDGRVSPSKTLFTHSPVEVSRGGGGTKDFFSFSRVKCPLIATFYPLCGRTQARRGGMKGGGGHGNLHVGRLLRLVLRSKHVGASNVTSEVFHDKAALCS